MTAGGDDFQPPEPSTGSYSWRLGQVERKLEQLGNKSDDRHEENRDKLDELKGDLKEVKKDVEHLAASVEKVGKAAWMVVGVVVAAITIAVLRLVGPTLGSSAELPSHVEQPHP